MIKYFPLFFLPFVLGAQNLIGNADFSEGRNGWSCWGGSGCVWTANRESGGMLSIPEGRTAVSRKFDAEPGTEYRLDCIVSGKASKLGIAFHTYDGKGVYSGEYPIFDGAPPETPTKVSGRVKFPAGTKQAAVVYLVYAGKIAIASTSVKVAEKEPPENLFPNAGFRISNRGDGWPDAWSLVGANSADMLVPDWKTGKYAKVLPPGPVSGASVIELNGPKLFGSYIIMCMPDTVYTFSIYVKSAHPGTPVELISPLGRTTFSADCEWKRRTYTKKMGARAGRDMFLLVNPTRANLFFSAPQLEIGESATPWIVSPRDSSLRMDASKAPLPEAARTPESFPSSGSLLRPKCAWKLGKDFFEATVLLPGGKQPGKVVSGYPSHPNLDIAELFVSPRESGYPYLHFMAGSDGTHYAETGRGYPFKEKFECTYRETSEGLEVTWRIPLESFGTRGDKIWRFNPAVSPARGTAFAGAGENSFHAPRKFLFLNGMPSWRGEESADGQETIRPSVPGKEKRLEQKRSVSFDRTARCWRKNGKPFLPIAFKWLGRRFPLGLIPGQWEIDELKSKGINTIEIGIERSLDLNRYLPEYQRAWQAFDRAGFAVVLTPNPDPVTLFKKGFSSELAGQADLLRRLKDDPVPFAWNYIDEPGPHFEKRNISEKDLSEGYRKLSAEFPERLHFINWNHHEINEGGKMWGGLGNTDILSYDHYCFTGFHFDSLREFAASARKVSEIGVRNGLPTHVIAQTYGFQDVPREPSPAEYRNIIFSAMIAGINGVSNFCGRPENELLWTEMGETYRAIQEWFDLTAGKPSVLYSETPVHAVIHRIAPGKYTLLAANTAYRPSELKLPFAPSKTSLRFGEGAVTGSELNLPGAGAGFWILEGTLEE